jgi:hypothetical protein
MDSVKYPIEDSKEMFGGISAGHPIFHSSFRRLYRKSVIFQIVKRVDDAHYLHGMFENYYADPSKRPHLWQFVGSYKAWYTTPYDRIRGKIMYLPNRDNNGNS